jgi:hypothetical protein
MLVKSGSYTGNGTSQTITIGFAATPKLVLVKSATTDIGVFRTDTMATDSAKPFGATALATSVITALGSGSFSIGSDARVNSNGVTYYWIALAHDGTNNDIETGSYTGNGLDNQDKSLSVITATPDMVWIASEGGERPYFRTSDFSGDSAKDFGGLSATTNIIQSFGVGTYQIGNRAGAVNTNGTAYHWIAFVNTANNFKVLTYNGDGSDNRSITGAGFAPDNAFTKRFDSTNEIVFRPKDVAGDSSTTIANGTPGWAADQIQARESDGFQVGTNATVNIATATPPYYAFVFKDTPVSGGGSGKGGGGGGKGGGGGGTGGGGKPPKGGGGGTPASGLFVSGRSRRRTGVL